MARAHAYTTPGPKSRSSRTSRTSTGGPCLGARGKQAQLAQANGRKFNLLLMLVAQMSTYPRAIATHYCSWGGAERHYRQAYDLNASPGKVWGRWWWRGRS